MKSKSNIEKAQKIMDDRKKDRTAKSLDKDPKKAGLEQSMRNIADKAKQEGVT